MATSKQEKIEELKLHSNKIQEKIKELFSDHIKDIDFSYINLFTVLLFSEMHHDPQNPGWAGRDRLVISNLKAIPSLFAVFAQIGYINWKEFHDLVLKLPRLFSNPNLALVNYPGVDFMTDSAYYGMMQSLGYALSGRYNRQEFRVYHVLPDKRSTGVQGALISAASAKLTNFTSVIPFLDLQKKSAAAHFWFSMGWHIEEVKFEELSSIFEGFARISRSREKPQAMLG
jgi:transketolase